MIFKESIYKLISTTHKFNLTVKNILEFGVNYLTVNDKCLNHKKMLINGLNQKEIKEYRI